MKKYISFFTVILCLSGMQAQEISDALRYSLDNTNGTARFRAMSGAFGALGGDLSAINVNPAGSAIFANNQVALSLNNYGIKNNSNYFGTHTSETSNSFDLNQAGFVFIFENEEAPTWKKISIAVNYENAANFENSLFSAGTNPLHSGTQYFLSYANGIPTSDLDYYYYDELGFAGQQAHLAYWTYLIDPETTDVDNDTYVSNISATGNYYQENEIMSTGYNGKLTFNAAAQYNDVLYLGLNLNSHFTDYRKSTSFYEDYVGATNANAQNVQAFRFNNDIYTYGNGFSFQLGAIAKLSKEIRLGLAYESPTWMTLNDELTQSLVVDCPDCPPLDPDRNGTPHITNVYEPYKISTPSKWTGSFAYVFGKSGLLSIDYSSKDYGATEFRPHNDFRNINDKMAADLQRAGELRIGAEHKIKQWSLRAGYRLEQSPYKNKDVMGDLTGYSGGIGYNFGSTKLDFACSTAKRMYGESFFNQGMIDRAKIDSKNNNITVTLAFEL